jgi:hypothetical protein
VGLGAFLLFMTACYIISRFEDGLELDVEFKGIGRILCIIGSIISGFTLFLSLLFFLKNGDSGSFTWAFISGVVLAFFVLGAKRNGASR